MTYVVQAVASDFELHIVDDLKGNLGRMFRVWDKRSFVWAASHVLDSCTEASCTLALLLSIKGCGALSQTNYSGTT